ncbi:MAG TPA: heme ABC exporter ATP-binding protein CcmA [Ktedonobacterales bacterium]|jgi:heme exporter protein A
MTLDLSPAMRENIAMQPAVENAVVVADVRKTFEFKPVLRGVSLAVPAGATVALLGPNGAGKTTLLRILATLARPTTGEVTIDGLDLRRDAQAIRQHIGYLGHQPMLYEELTAEENLDFFARMNGVQNRHARVNAMIERVGLRQKAKDRVRDLSRGQTQRLALARALLHEPSLLLLDEPDSGLDEQGIALLEEVLRERSVAGQTAIFTTHDLAWGLRVADRAMALVAGRLTYDGTAALSPDEARTAFRWRETREGTR